MSLPMFQQRTIFSNSLWMMAEKSISIFGLIFVNSFMAKYIGPENFGKISFTTSVFAFVQVLSWFGAQNILFKRMSEDKYSGLNLALNSQNQRRILFFISSALLLAYLFFYSDRITFIFGLANFIASYYIIIDVFSIYNNSQLNSQINTISNVIGIGGALLIRYLITWFKLPVYYFTLPLLLMPAIPYLIRYFYFKKQNIKTMCYKKNRYNKYLLHSGGALLLSTLSITIYTQISNIFLAKLVSYEKLGVYSIALTLGAAWSFIAQALITSYFTKIYSERNQAQIKKLLAEINRIIILITIFILMGFEFFGHWFIVKLYGVNYLDALSIIPVIIIGTMFSLLGTVSYRYMIKYNGYRYLTIKMLIVCLISLPLSYVLVLKFGISGASYTMLALEFLSCTIANYYFSNGIVFKIHLSTIGIKND